MQLTGATRTACRSPSKFEVEAQDESEAYDKAASALLTRFKAEKLRGDFLNWFVKEIA
jgi:hypothetical protein